MDIHSPLSPPLISTRYPHTYPHSYPQSFLLRQTEEARLYQDMTKSNDSFRTERYENISITSVTAAKTSDSQEDMR